jgi:hypothetical protein
MPARLSAGYQASVWIDTKGGSKLTKKLCMPGAGVNSGTNRKALSEMSALKPYWGKPAVRNFREDGGNNGIMRSPLSASILLDPYTRRRRG